MFRGTKHTEYVKNSYCLLGHNTIIDKNEHELAKLLHYLRSKKAENIKTLNLTDSNNYIVTYSFKNWLYLDNKMIWKNSYIVESCKLIVNKSYLEQVKIYIGTRRGIITKSDNLEDDNVLITITRVLL